MTSFSGTPVSSLRMLTLTPQMKAGPELLARLRAGRPEVPPPRSDEEIAAQIAKQNAIEAHTVFRIDGRIVAVQTRGGGTVSAGAGSGAAHGASGEASQRGLTGAARDDFIADRIEEALRQKYGSRLEVTRHDSGSAPTMGELHSRIFGPPSTEALATLAQPVTFDAETLAMLDRIREAQATRAARFAEIVNGSGSGSAD